MDRQDVIPNDALSSNDGSLDVRGLRPNSPYSPAKSRRKDLQITITLPSGGAPISEISLPTHTNIILIQILFVLPGEAKPLAFRGGKGIPCDKPINIPRGITAQQVIIIVLEKLEPDQPIFITINIFACFEMVHTTAAYTSTTLETCDQKEFDFNSGSIIPDASSFEKDYPPENALKGSVSYWSPAKDDKGEVPYIEFVLDVPEQKANIYHIMFTVRYAKNVVISLHDKANKNVDSSDPIRCKFPKDQKDVSFNFRGQEGVKIIIYVTRMKNSLPPRISNVMIHACYEELVPTTLTVIMTTTPSCGFKCSDDKCINSSKICNGRCDCSDCLDEENCAPTTTSPIGNWGSWSPWSECSQTCGVGFEIRRRNCNSPRPGGTGRGCEGEATQSRRCKKRDCEGLPTWTPWSEWSPCSVECGVGEMTRYRECDNSPAKVGQPDCVGPAKETVTCRKPACKCIFSMETFSEIFGYQPSAVIGWVEKDGQFGPTDPAEDVRVGDPVEDGVVVHVQCNNCTCSEGSIECDIGKCEDCLYTTWSEWSECSKSCNVGQKTRTKKLLSRGDDAKKCEKKMVDRADCNTNHCPTEQPATWGTWGPWSECSTTEPCTWGSRKRTRECNLIPSSRCYGDAIETEPCSFPCPTTPICSEGRVWSECSNRCPQTCMDVRIDNVCNEPEKCEPGCACAVGQVEFNGHCIDAYKCPCFDKDGNIIMPGFETNPSPCETCVCTNGSMVCEKDENCCEWSSWGPWGESSVTCGQGVRNRYRNLLNGVEDICGDRVDQGPFIEKECPADCIENGKSFNIGDIMSDDGCLVCHCTADGKDCGNNTNAIVDGKWSPWSPWSGCSATCGIGKRQRTRQCNNPLPQCGGRPCKGDNTQLVPCSTSAPCCDVSCWSDWTACPVTCDTGVQYRYRQYYDQKDSEICNKTLTESRSCNPQPCGIKCTVSLWSEWSACSASCGLGKKVRTRQILGKVYEDCPSRLQEIAPCYTEDCECPPDMVWTNNSACQHTCANLFTGPPKDCDDIESPGCRCKKDLYRDENGNCVKFKECQKCYINGEVKFSGDTWSDPSDKCYICECVGGNKECTRVCEIPKCAENEVLSYDVPNKCCPICQPRKDNCHLETRYEKIISPEGDCETVEPVEVTSCHGSCGNSSSQVTLMLNPQQDEQETDCQCCTGVVKLVRVVDVQCKKAKTKKAYLPVFGECKCQRCGSVVYTSSSKG